MGIINLGQADDVIEENQSGDIVANLDVVDAGSVSATSIDTDSASVTNEITAEEVTADGATPYFRLNSVASNPGVVSGKAKIYLFDTGSGYELRVGFGNGTISTIATD